MVRIVPCHAVSRNVQCNVYAAFSVRWLRSLFACNSEHSVVTDLHLDKGIKILVVDDHRLFAAGMSSVLQNMERPVEVKELHNGMQALSELEHEGSYDLVLADIEMPSVSGIDLLLALQARNIATPLIIVSASEHEGEVERAISAGARGYIPKRLTPESILDAVEQVLRGEIFFPHDVAPRGRDRQASQAQPAENPSKNTKVPKLSSRQLEILDLMESGKTNKQIAEVLGISQSTVKFHIAGLFRELNVRTRTECVHVARQLNVGGIAT